MEILDNSIITYWPEQVSLAFCETSAQVDDLVLTAQEKEEYEAFTNKNRKSEYLIGRALFRYLISKMQLNPNQVELKKEEKGKPFAKYKDEIIHVSFSHSSSLVMCAISRELNIGLDVESTKRKVDDRVVKRVLNENEWKEIGYQNPLKLWTIKEAAVKCSGLGLQTKLKNLDIRKENNNRFFLTFNDEINVEICSFSALNHQIALAYQRIHS